MQRMPYVFAAHFNKNKMIKEIKMYTVVCDNCGRDVNEDADYSCWEDKGYAEDSAMESDWKKEDNKHYCTNCFVGYDKEDELIIKGFFCNCNPPKLMIKDKEGKPFCLDCRIDFLQSQINK